MVSKIRKFAGALAATTVFTLATSIPIWPEVARRAYAEVQQNKDHAVKNNTMTLANQYMLEKQEAEKKKQATAASIATSSSLPVQSFRRNTVSLEEIIRSNVATLPELTSYEHITLATLVPLKRTIETESAYYGIKPADAAKFFLIESSLIPIDVNTKSNDYGLGQINLRSLDMTVNLIAKKKSKYYNPRYDFSKSVFDPQNNVILATATLRYLMDTRNLDDFSHVYAVYVKGDDSIDQYGNIKGYVEPIVNAMNERGTYIERLLPYFKADKKVVENSRDDIATGLIDIYRQNKGCQETYQAVSDFLYDSLRKPHRAPDARALLFEASVIMHLSARELFNYKPDRTQDLLRIGKEVYAQQTITDYSQRVNRRLNYLQASLNRKEPFETFDKVTGRTTLVSDSGI